jgi:hypothetical protein
MNLWRSRIAAAAIAVLAFQASSLPVSGMTEEDAIFENGKDDMVAGNYYRAASRFRRLLKEYPETQHRSEALLLLSSSCIKSGRLARAKEHMEVLVREYPPGAVIVTPEAAKASAEALPAPAPSVAPEAAIVPVVETREIPVAPPLREPVDPPVPQVATVEPPAPPAPAAPPEIAPAPNACYTVVAGEPLSPRMRDALVKKLRRLDLRPSVVATEKAFAVHRLLAGRYSNPEEAARRRAAIADVSRSSAFVSRVDNANCVFAGSYVSRENALHEQRRLEKRGVSVELVPATVPLKVWRVTLGKYQAEGDAASVAAVAAGAGVVPRIERDEDPSAPEAQWRSEERVREPASFRSIRR